MNFLSFNTSGVGTAYSSGTPEFFPGYSSGTPEFFPGF